MRTSKKVSCFWIIGLWIIALAVSSMPGCGKKEPIKVGFVGGLTGRLSDLGISGRNGVMLAVEKVNQDGGINGRPVELITKDDRQDVKAALQADRELIRAGVVAIIGHMTSAMSTAAVPLINEEEMVMISPTTSTSKLTGIDDYFFRVMPPNKSISERLARHSFKEKGLRKMAGVYDLSNRAYTEGFNKDFKDEFEKMGGKVIQVDTFTSGPGVKFSVLANLLLKPSPDGLFIGAGAMDTAMICQQIRMAGSKIPIISSGWAMTDDFIRHGGSNVEGVLFSHRFNRESQAKGYLEFKENYEKRFGSEPNFAALHGYEAAMALFKCLKENDDPKALKATLLKQGMFQGVQKDFKMDQYGDPQREEFLFTVKQGKFRTME